MAVTTLPRKFKVGTLVLDDPSQNLEQLLDINEVHRIHAQQYPQLRHTHIWNEDGEISEHNGEQVILFQYYLAPISVNG